VYLKILIFLLINTSLLTASSKVTFLLKNNDIIVGQLIEKKLKLHSDFGILNVDMNRIKEIEFLKNPKITFANNDVLEAKIKLHSFTVDCEFGKLKIELSKLASLTRGEVSHRDPELIWSETKDGLRLGAKVKVKELNYKKVVSVYSELINESGKDKSIRFPEFYGRVLKEGESLDQAYSIALKGTQKDKRKILEQMAVAQMKGPTLKSGAKIIIEFEMEIENSQNFERAMALEMRDNLPMKINKILHFKQKVDSYDPKEGKNNLQVIFRYGDKENEVLKSPKLVWENKP